MLKRAVREATNHLLRSKNARRYNAVGRTFVLDIERDVEDPTYLVVTTWGFDYERIRIPQSRQELIRMKIFAQTEPTSPIDTVILRYCLDILRREDAHYMRAH